MSKNEKELQTQSLAVKYRPRKLEHLIGQSPVVSVLEGIFKSKKIPAAFLLTGGTGLGKTTTARMIAQYINCDTMDACGKCKNCIAMKSSNHPDYEEINIAGEGGKDDLRNIVRKAYNRPRMGAFRIILLDECFPADTEVEVESGVFRTISDICADQGITEVLSFNHETGQIESKPIISRTPSIKKDLVEVHMADGSVQECTDNHAWWSVTRQKYVRADELLEGEELLVGSDSAASQNTSTEV